MGDVLGGMQPYGRFLAGMGRNISKGGMSDQLLARAGKKKLTKKRARQLGLRSDEYTEDTSEADALEKKRLQEEDRLIRKEDRELTLKRATPFHERTPEEQESILGGIKAKAEAGRAPPTERGPTVRDQKIDAVQGLLGGAPERGGYMVPSVQQGPVAGQSEPPMTPEQHAARSAAFESQQRPAPTKRQSGKLSKLTTEERAIVASGSESIAWGIARVDRRELEAKKEKTEADKARIKELEEIEATEKDVSALRIADPNLTEKRARDLQKIGVTAKDLYNEQKKAQAEQQKGQDEQKRESKLAAVMRDISESRNIAPTRVSEIIMKAQEVSMDPSRTVEDQKDAKELLKRIKQTWPELVKG